MISREVRDKLTQVTLRRNIIFPSAGIYPPMGGMFDLGPVGKGVRDRIVAIWKKLFIERNGYFEVDTSLILPEMAVKASGHLDHFSDPVTTCKSCGAKFRADQLLEENKIETAGTTVEDINRLLHHSDIKCLNCGKNGFTDVAFFNLMFKTNIGPVEGTAGYLRPETAQGIFMAFPRIFKTYGKLPLAMGQVGRSFRNEISPRQGVVRLREFNQMELEYFFDPNDQSFPRFKEMADRKVAVLTCEEQEKGTVESRAEQRKNESKPTVFTCQELLDKKIAPNEITAYFIGLTFEFYEACGVPFESMRFRQLPARERAHYSGGTFDLEVQTSFGWLETVSLAYRTDYDLKSHEKVSGGNVTVVTPDGRRIVPHVVEPSFGIDRLLWAVLEHSYREKDEAHDWEWLDLPVVLSPYNVAIFPLMKKDGLAEKAQEISSKLRDGGLTVIYDESGSIGKRYARADEIGMKWAVTIDYDTLKDGTVTLRDRNTAKQIRIKIEDIFSSVKQ